MQNIHHTAIVSDKAQLGENVKVGPFSIIEDDVIVGDNTEIRSSVVLADGARVGHDCTLCHGVVIATEPQDLKFGGEPTTAEVGNNTLLREYVTINRGTSATGRTILGSDCMIMTYSHIAHDCRVGDNVIMSNATQLAGHVTIEDWVITGGVVKVHQFCKVGCHAMVGADVKVVKDIPPYTLIGNKKIDSINKIGLRRRGFTREQIQEIDRFYHILIRSGLNTSDALAKYRKEYEISDIIAHCIDFIDSSNRGIYR